MKDNTNILSNLNDALSTSKQRLPIRLRGFMLWAVGVGLTISGCYFDWNLGLVENGTLGVAFAMGIVVLLFLTLCFSYAELASMMPKADGGTIYVKKGLGNRLGFLAGISQLTTYMVLSATIAMNIGVYMNFFFPEVPIVILAVLAYFFFCFLNIVSVKLAAWLEIILSLGAIGGLVVFAVVTLPFFEPKNLIVHPLPDGYINILKALPFVLGFFLAIEGIATLSEETTHAQRNVVIGFGMTVLLITIISILTFSATLGVSGWEIAVYGKDGAPYDTPLPLVIEELLGMNHYAFIVTSWGGFVALLAAFNALIMVAGRTVMGLGRQNYLTRWFGKTDRFFGTPANALFGVMLVGALLVLITQNAQIVDIAYFSAIVLYILAMLSLFSLRFFEPKLRRTFHAPLYPVFPLIALVLSLLVLVVLIMHKPLAGLSYLLIISIASVYYWALTRQVFAILSPDKNSFLEEVIDNDPDLITDPDLEMAEMLQEAKTEEIIKEHLILMEQNKAKKTPEIPPETKPETTKEALTDDALILGNKAFEKELLDELNKEDEDEKKEDLK